MRIFSIRLLLFCLFLIALIASPAQAIQKKRSHWGRPFKKYRTSSWRKYPYRSSRYRYRFVSRRKYRAAKVRRAKRARRKYVYRPTPARRWRVAANWQRAMEDEAWGLPVRGRVKEEFSLTPTVRFRPLESSRFTPAVPTRVLVASAAPRVRTETPDLDVEEKPIERSALSFLRDYEAGGREYAGRHKGDWQQDDGLPSYIKAVTVEEKSVSQNGDYSVLVMEGKVQTTADGIEWEDRDFVLKMTSDRGVAQFRLTGAK